jgi:hypothetical protein
VSGKEFGVVCGDVRARGDDMDGLGPCERLYPHLGWHSRRVVREDGEHLVEWDNASRQVLVDGERA